MCRWLVARPKLSRYGKRYRTQYDDLRPDHIGFAWQLQRHINLKGKSVLEIGGSNYPAEILFDDLRAAKWTCVDYLQYWEELNDGTNPAAAVGDTADKSGSRSFPLEEAEINFNAHRYCKFSGNAADIPDYFTEKFDVASSLCCFEHVHQLDKVIENIYRSLRPGGTFCTFFGPIWSGPLGHHYWLNKRTNFNHIGGDRIPPFTHLLYSEEEIRRYCERLVLPHGNKQLEALCHWSYHTDKLNHLFYEDYAALMERSPFSHWSIVPYWRHYISRKTMAELRSRYPGYKRFDVSGIFIEAVK